MGDLWSTKAPTVPSTNLGIVTRDGIAPLQADVRRMFEALPSSDPGAGALHVEHFEVASHGVASGTVQRVPTATTTKAEVDTTIAYETLDLVQWAATISTIPAQLLESQPKLASTLQAVLGVELEKSMDLHVYVKIDDSGAAVFSGGADVVTKLARGVTDLRRNGANADLAFVADTDYEALGLTTEANRASAFPFSLEIVPSQQLGAGELIVMDRSGVVFHKAAATFMLDPYSGMATNTLRVRAELNGLLEVIEPKKIVKSASSLVT